jgi:hypothetical protein
MQLLVPLPIVYTGGLSFSLLWQLLLAATAAAIRLKIFPAPHGSHLSCILGQHTLAIVPQNKQLTLLWVACTVRLGLHSQVAQDESYLVGLGLLCTLLWTVLLSYIQYVLLLMSYLPVSYSPALVSRQESQLAGQAASTGSQLPAPLPAVGNTLQVRYYFQIQNNRLFFLSLTKCGSSFYFIPK